ncbi:MAG: glycosyltransferase family 61 protein [Cyanobacteria bacterium SID2]|nr:glycosyltransferase family 61 protein [Cyanobacteria bacterium SID2]
MIHSTHVRKKIQLRSPHTLDDRNHPRFNILKYRSPETFVATIPDGYTVWGGNTSIGSRGILACITPTRELLADVSPRFPQPDVDYTYPSPQTHWVFDVPALPDLETFGGTVAVLAAFAGDVGTANYFHWFIDLVSRVGLLQQAGIDLQSIDGFLVDRFNPNISFQRHSLDVLGIPTEKVLSIHEHSHLQAQHLIVPAIPGKLTFASQFTVDFLRNTYRNRFRQAGVNSSKRLYITRQNAQYRRVLNEDAVLQVLQPLGFTSIAPETLSFPEQVSLFSQAEAIIAPHGAGLTNIAFCEPDTKIIELFPADYVLPYYWILASEAELNYFYLVGKGIDCPNLHRLVYPNSMNADLFVNLDELRLLIQKIF